MTSPTKRRQRRGPSMPPAPGYELSHVFGDAHGRRNCPSGRDAFHPRGAQRPVSASSYHRRFQLYLLKRHSSARYSAVTSARGSAARGRTRSSVGRVARGNRTSASRSRIAPFNTRMTRASSAPIELIGDLSRAATKARLAAALAVSPAPRLDHRRLGYLSNAADAANVLYRAVNERYLHGRPILLTTNKPLATLGDVVHDGDLARHISEEDSPSRRAKSA